MAELKDKNLVFDSVQAISTARKKIFSIDNNGSFTFKFANTQSGTIALVSTMHPYFDMQTATLVFLGFTTSDYGVIKLKESQNVSIVKSDVDEITITSTNSLFGTIYY